MNVWPHTRLTRLENTCKIPDWKLFLVSWNLKSGLTHCRTSLVNMSSSGGNLWWAQFKDSMARYSGHFAISFFEGVDTMRRWATIFTIVSECLWNFTFLWCDGHIWAYIYIYIYGHMGMDYHRIAENRLFRGHLSPLPAGCPETQRRSDWTEGLEVLGVMLRWPSIWSEGSDFRQNAGFQRCHTICHNLSQSVTCPSPCFAHCRGEMRLWGLGQPHIGWSSFP